MLTCLQVLLYCIFMPAFNCTQCKGEKSFGWGFAPYQGSTLHCLKEVFCLQMILICQPSHALLQKCFLMHCSCVVTHAIVADETYLSSYMTIPLALQVYGTMRAATPLWFYWKSLYTSNTFQAEQEQDPCYASHRRFEIRQVQQEPVKSAIDGSNIGWFIRNQLSQPQTVRILAGSADTG